MGKKQLCTSEFIARSNEKHGFKFDYSKSIYTTSHDKITVTCPEHGDFTLKAYSHMQGIGCPACGGVKRHTTESAISYLKGVFGDKYDYSKFLYKGNKAKSIVICPDHGEFLTSFNPHSRGAGCPLCAPNSRKTREYMIDKFISVHGDKYDYSEFEHNGNKTKSKFKCKEHGHEFMQTPSDHANGYGCMECYALRKKGAYTLNSLSDEDKDKPCKLYFIEFQAPDERVFHKIGVTINTIDTRFGLAKRRGYEYKIVSVIDDTLENCLEMEELILDQIKEEGNAYKVHDFKDNNVGGWTECFRPYNNHARHFT